MNALSINYGLAPEHVCPEGVEDCERVLKTLSEKAAGPVFVAGDSSGCAIALAAVMRHRDARRRMPDAMYFISPWLDMTLSGDSVVNDNKRCAMLRASGLEECAEMYVDSLDAKSVDASPLFGRMSELPPTLIQFGQHDLLRDDAARFAERLEAADIDHRAERWQGMFHDFQLYAPVMDEARTAIKSAGKWLQAQT